jgi:hypothetical protein
MHSMEFDVWPVRREGKLIPKWQVAPLRLRGILTVGEERDDVSHRLVRIARLQDSKGKDLLLPLRDVQLICIRPYHWSMTGYEHKPLDYTEGSVGYQQSWVLCPAECRDRDEAERTAREAARSARESAGAAEPPP